MKLWARVLRLEGARAEVCGGGTSELIKERGWGVGNHRDRRNWDAGNGLWAAPRETQKSSPWMSH